MVVYKVTNLVNGKIYIGATIRPLHVRWRCHRYDKNVLGPEIRAYGIDSFKIEEIYRATSLDDMYEKEKHLIQVFQSFEPHGYNRLLGGKKGVQKTEASRRRHSDSQKRRFARDGASRQGTTGKLNPRSKPVRCIETGEVFESARQAAIKLGIKSREMITKVIKGKKKSIYGYRFEYVDRSFAVGEG